jgi:hypothetical protein
MIIGNTVVAMLGVVNSEVTFGEAGKGEARFSLRDEQGVYYLKVFDPALIALCVGLKQGHLVRVFGRLHSFVWARCGSHHVYVEAEDIVLIAEDGREESCSPEVLTAAEEIWDKIEMLCDLARNMPLPEALDRRVLSPPRDEA